MRRLFTVFGVVAIGGCSLFGFDDFSGGEDPNATDGGGTNPDAPGGGGGDATPNDGAPTEDGGGVDTGLSGPFCDTVGADAAVCDDFEKPGTFTGKWPEKDTYLGTLEVMDAIGFGGGRGLRFSATPRADGQVGQDGRVILGYETPTNAKLVDCEVAVKITSLPPTTYSAAPIHITFVGDPSYGREAIGFYLGGGGVLSINPIVFDTNGGFQSGGPGKDVATLALNTWTRVRLVADLQPAVPTLTVYVDGKLVHERTMDTFKTGKAQVRIGANYVGTTDGGTVGFDLDDARISWK